MWPALQTTLRGLTGVTRVLLITGDWSGVPAATKDASAVEMTAADVVHRLRDTTLISIAVLAGPVRSAPLRLALACTLRVAAPDAVLLVDDVHAGAAPPADVVEALRQSLGFGAALELAVTGRPLPAVEAVARGIALPGTQEDARDLAAAILAAPDDAVRATVASLRSGAPERAAAEHRGPRGMLHPR